MGQRQRHREDFQAESPVESQRLRDTLPAHEEKCRLLTADGDHRDDRHVGGERQSNESFVTRELDLMAVPRRPVRFPVAA